MRTSYVYVTLVLLALGAGTAARAQLPYPFNPEPDFKERLWCTKDYVQSVESELAVMEKLHAAGPTTVGRLCKLIDMGSTWLDGKLSDDVRSELRSLLGVDVDLDRLRTQCRTGRDNLEEALINRIGQLKAELLRCDNTLV